MSAENDDEFFESKAAAVKEVGGSSGIYYGVALGLSILPVFLFYTVYKQNIGVVYLIVTTISTVLLATAYQKVQSREKLRLWRYRQQDKANAHKKYGLSKNDYDAKRMEITSQEALTFSLFRNNLTYVLFFLFFAFYAFKDINREFCYAVSVGASSVLVWKFSDWL
mmetsp:Transcript_514/g.847  ORF Transcript_514/g.847 Transcript_514/m.847 type:complete len:166 (+) Transcript_514:58-555(+)|eukprot:CAMPEP_0197515478 /NCGR_PEP_ID=MMETSP1318-20131121/606_1 /TAXON_ID=552666 /ORGANISM="Partenskyella glossopodia, Strain RCC365" /LENGTH=165 /DNA_ID=CAMNT_0043063867 /DNA_START=45 /DNA_END=542 /DNA_ORIENTATION=+